MMRAASFWGRRGLVRGVLYAMALAVVGIAPVRTYMWWVDWARSSTAPPSAANQNGEFLWFRLAGDQLAALDGPMSEPDVVGLDFLSGTTIMDPPDLELGLVSTWVCLADTTWADPSRSPPPDNVEMAHRLIDATWARPGVPYTVSALGPGVYEARYEKLSVIRAVARSQAMPETRTALLWLLSILCVGEGLAWVGRRVVLIPPGGCKTCGYPLANIPSLTCPECGTQRADSPGEQTTG